jgi:hypothetical protein
MPAFRSCPDILLKQQKRLGLSPTELVVLINLTMHWWYEQQMPFPRSTTIARRMGLDVRTVQRAMNRLQTMRLIEKKKVRVEDTELTVFDLSGHQPTVPAERPHARERGRDDAVSGHRWREERCSDRRRDPRRLLGRERRGRARGRCDRHAGCDGLRVQQGAGGVWS